MMDSLTLEQEAEWARESWSKDYLPKAPQTLPLINYSDWAGTPPDRRSALGNSMLPLRQTTMLTGGGGVGKSLWQQMASTCIALGLPFLGMETLQLNSLYITCEDDADELWRRQSAINAALGVEMSDLEGKLMLTSLCGMDGVEIASLDPATGQLAATDRWQQLKATVEQKNIRLFAFDNATDAMAGDHSDLHQVAAFVNLLTGLAIQMDGVAMVLHHPNKAGEDWLGSVAWHNKVRSRLIIERGDEGDPDARTITNPKSNYGPTGGKIHFRWYKGAFVTDDELPDDYAAELAVAIKANGENEAFLNCLRQRANEGEGRLVGPSPGPNYAPAQFEKMTAAKGYKKAQLQRAMERLFAVGQIETHSYRNTTKGRDVTIIREVEN